MLYARERAERRSNIFVHWCLPYCWNLVLQNVEIKVRNVSQALLELCFNVETNVHNMSHAFLDVYFDVEIEVRDIM